MKRLDGKLIEYPDVFATAYEACDGSVGMVLTNYLHEEKEIIFSDVKKVWTNPSDENDYIMTYR